MGFGLLKEYFLYVLETIAAIAYTLDTAVGLSVKEVGGWTKTIAGVI